MPNRLSSLFESGRKNLLSVYYTAGFPELDDTLPIAEALQNSGADLIEIGIPFSDPIADGPVIQASNDVALKNGMKLNVLFSQIKEMRESVDIPVLLMGYFNPIFQFGVENFCLQCKQCGIDGLIIPDMPLWEYEQKWKLVFEKFDLFNVFLVTPQTPLNRILKIDDLSSSFIYVVSSSAVTGVKNGSNEGQIEYFNRINSLKLKSPILIGFGISSKTSFKNACKYSNGAIIGSAFIDVLSGLSDKKKERYSPVGQFVDSIISE